MDSDGEDDLGVGGLEVFFLRWEMVPWLILALMTTGSARGDACEETLGLGTMVFAETERGEDGGFVTVGFRGVPGEPTGEGNGGNGGDSFR